MQHPSVRAPAQKPIVIEVAGEPFGVVIPSESGFRFMAVRFPVFSLDGKLFETVDAARLAASHAVQSDAL